MENEIKRLEKNRSVTIVVMLVIMLAIVLSACTVSAGGEPHVKSKSEKAIEQAKTILQGIKSGDAEKIADQFSPIAKEKHPELENDIKKWMGFLDGEIISYGDLLVIDTKTQEKANMEDKDIDLSDAQKSVGYDDVYWEW